MVSRSDGIETGGWSWKEIESSFPWFVSTVGVRLGTSEGRRRSLTLSRVGGRRSDAKVVVVIVIARRGIPSFLVSRIEAEVAFMADRRARFR